MTATTSTVIRGVSILSGQKKPGQDAFELGLSREGIEVRRPGRPMQQMSWERVSEWEIEERKGYVLLTLRGQGATTPLVVPGWTLDDLEILMRDVTAGGTAPAADGHAPEVVDGDKGGTGSAAAAETPVQDPAPTPTRAERRKLAARSTRRRRPSGRMVVTVVLLGVLATAVVLVLLQSAGVIDWSFLGPVA